MNMKVFIAKHSLGNEDSDTTDNEAVQNILMKLQGPVDSLSLLEKYDTLISHLTDGQPDRLSYVSSAIDGEAWSDSNT